MTAPRPTPDRLWPVTSDPDEIERVELEHRGLPQSTYHALARAADRWPHRTAVQCLPDGEHWESPVSRTFAELAADVHRAASVLAGFGVGRRDAVAVVSVNCAEMIAAVLAAEAVGVVAPINPALATEHAAELVKLSGARVIVAAGPELDTRVWTLARALAAETGARALLALRPTAPDSAAPALEPLAGTTVAHLASLMADAPADALPAEAPRADAIASYLHTGGTTGAPKLAARTHGNEIANAWMIGTRLDVDGAVLAALPLFHTNALIVTLLAPLLRGLPVVWAGPLGYRDPALFSVFWRLVEHYDIAAMSAVPTVYAALATLPIDADISSLRMPIVGAAPLPRAVAEAFRDHTGLDLCEGYGLTEGTCASACNLPGEARPGSVGRRLPYQQVCAARGWDPLPDGEVGTLLVKGPNVFAGYLVDGVAHAGDKVRDGWLDTGDLGRVDADGYVWLVGRAKDLIIRGGHNIDPVVIEDALLEHPAVTAAAAVGRPDAHAGEVPVAYAVLAPGATVTAEGLRAWTVARVPEPAAAPKRVDVIDAIPVTTVGKPFKPELRRRAAEAVAREALAGRARAVTARLIDGRAVVVYVEGADEAVIEDALGPFDLAWEHAGSRV